MGEGAPKKTEQQESPEEEYRRLSEAQQQYNELVSSKEAVISGVEKIGLPIAQKFGFVSVRDLVNALGTKRLELRRQLGEEAEKIDREIFGDEVADSSGDFGAEKE